MMLVKILKFGSNWWASFGRDPQDRYRFTRHAAYFNSAGVRCGNKIRRHWIVPGLVRFNGAGDFNPHFSRRSVGETFECVDLAFACGGNRLLFVRKARPFALPEFCLTAVSSEEYGEFNFDDPGWKPESVMPIAVSHLHHKQEAMLLMKTGDWVRTKLGVWQLRTTPAVPQGMALELLEDGVVS